MFRKDINKTHFQISVLGKYTTLWLNGLTISIELTLIKNTTNSLYKSIYYINSE